ncbi:MAG: hypothetical protein ABF785_04575 [Acetobacter papayae]
MLSMAALLLAPGISYATQSVVSGECGSGSHTAEGAFGEDLSKRQSRFYCDAAAIISENGQTLVQFSQKESHHNPYLGYAGKLSNDGNTMNVERIFFTPQDSAIVSEGMCKFFFKEKTLTGIMCGAKLDETGRRTTAIVTFDAKR